MSALDFKKLCGKIDKCEKVDMILDKDLFEFQYKEAIESVCSKCDEVQK